MTLDLLDPAKRRVAFIEAAAADALAPREEQRVDGWRLRADPSGTRRGNSALPEARGVQPLRRRLASVRAFYAARGRTARIQLSPAARPAGLDAALDRAGWIREEGAHVLVRSRLDGTDVVSSSDDPRVAPDDAGWHELQADVALARVEGAARRAADLHVAGLVAWHLLLRDAQGRPVAAGLAVLDPARAALGLFQLVTRPDARRRGWGRRLLEATLARGAASGAERAYLQVHGANEAALRLYRGLGFREHHRYHYRRAPDDDAAARGDRAGGR